MEAITKANINVLTLFGAAAAVIALSVAGFAADSERAGQEPETPAPEGVVDSAPAPSETTDGAAAASLQSGPSPDAEIPRPAVAPGPDKALSQQAVSPATRAASKDEVKRTVEGAFDMHARDADVRSILRQLSAQGQKNIITAKDVTGTVTADLYGVTFDEALEAILRAAGMAYRQDGGFIYVYTDEELAKLKKASQKMDVRVFRLAYLTSADAKQLVQGAVSPDGAVSVTPPPETGIATDSSKAGGKNHATDDVLVVRDYESNLEWIAKILECLDVKPQQILIEATILSVELNDDTALGVDLSALSGLNFEQFGATSDLSSISGGALPRFKNTQAGLSTTFAQNVPTGAMTIGIVRKDVALFIQALKTLTNVTVLANPKLLVVNKQRGEVLTGNSDGYITTTVTETASTQTVEFLETGTRLIVRPFIGTNGYVRLEVHPEDSSGSVIQVGGSALPKKATTEVTTNILVRDGSTVVIGGLFRDHASVDRSKVPFLGDMPYLGALFRSSRDITKRQEVIILITPHILEDDKAAATRGGGSNEGSALGLGKRESVRWFQKDRITAKWIQRARGATRRGETAQALWNVDRILSLDATHAEANRLRVDLETRTYPASRPSNLSSGTLLLERVRSRVLSTTVSEKTGPASRPAGPGTGPTTADTAPSDKSEPQERRSAP